MLTLWSVMKPDPAKLSSTQISWVFLSSQLRLAADSCWILQTNYTLKVMCMPKCTKFKLCGLTFIIFYQLSLTHWQLMQKITGIFMQTLNVIYMPKSSFQIDFHIHQLLSAVTSSWQLGLQVIIGLQVITKIEKGLISSMMIGSWLQYAHDAWFCLWELTVS